MLLQKVKCIMERGGFEYCFYDGCFDIAARRDFTIFLKVLNNVDSIQENQAKNLKIISREFGATVAIVGSHTRREMLKDNMLYERFDVPTFTPKTLENIIINDTFPFVYRFRGGLFAEINPDKLRMLRKKSNLTQGELAKRVGVSKKSIYEHEKMRKRAVLHVVKRIEATIGTVTDCLAIPKPYSEDINVPKEAFESLVSADLRRIGMKTDFVYQSPFNIIAKQNKLMLASKAGESKKKIEKDIVHIEEISRVTKIPSLIITKEEINTNLPSIEEKDLRQICSARELKKLLRQNF